MREYINTRFFLPLFLLLLLPSSALSSSLLGPLDLRINKWHYHTSFHSFQADPSDIATITITKEASKTAIINGFIVINFRLYPLKSFLRGENKSHTIKCNLRKSNRLFIFLRGMPGETLRVEVTHKASIEKPTATLTSHPSSLIKGQSTTLTWRAENADSIHIEPDIGPVTSNGSMIVSPEQTTIYSIIAKGPGGTDTSQAEVTVAPPPPTLEFRSEPSSIVKGEPTTLIWKTENATNCSIDNGIGSVTTSGNIDVSPITSTRYTITAEGPGGTSETNVEVKVEPIKLSVIEKSQAHYQTPENTLSASQSALLSKDLTWLEQAFTREAVEYENQLFTAAGIDPATVFQLTDENDEEYLLEIIPYKDGLLVVTETHYNDINGLIYTTAAGMVKEDNLWKITHKYSNDEELEQYRNTRYTNCIASYTFSPDATYDRCLRGNDLTLDYNTEKTLDIRDGEHQPTLIFNGVDSVLGREQLNDLSNKNISLGGWIKAQPADHDMTVIEIGSPTDNPIAITLPTGSGFRYTATIGGRNIESSTGEDIDFHDNNWHHLYLTFDGNTMKFYIDGEEKDSQPISGTIDAQPILNIGQSNGVQGNPSNHFKGMIDDIQIFNIALNKEQVLEKMTPDYR